MIVRRPWLGGSIFAAFCISGIEMKRKHPDSGKFFRRGDRRPDGYLFFAYTKRKRGDGFFVEIWLRPEASERATANDRQRKRQKAHGNRLGHASTDT